MKGELGTRAAMRWACAGIVMLASAGAWAQEPAPRALEEPRPGSVPALPQPGATAILPDAAELEAVHVDPALEALVERLEDPSYAARESATAELLSRPFENAQLYAVLTRRGLTAEQRHRLLSVVRDRLLKTPRGAVGIKVDRRWLPDKIVIEEVLPDLPARDVLRVGDRITHLQGRRLVNWDAFVDAVQSKVPGQRISVTVQRLVSGQAATHRDLEGGAPDAVHETIEIEIELGSADMLVDPLTGRPQGGGPVLTRRKREADLAMRRFSDEPRLVEIDE